MTIKEVEARTGLARANIRYYEDQGFFSAARGENGYRNYSGENVETLLKVKLFRQLGFSLEDIHDLQRGDQRLETALLRREEGLDREQLDLDRAARLCRELREERADFATLDPRRYLDRLEQENPPAALKEDRFPRRPFHLRRYCARMLDWLIWITLASLALTAGERLGVPLLEDTHLTAAFLSFGPMAVSETLLLHFTGATLGKKLLGMRLLHEDGSFLTLREAAGRTLQVMISFAFYILAAMYGVLGDSTAGYVHGIAFFVVWAWRFGDETSSLLDKYFYFWKRDNELYLDGSTRDKSFWDQEETKPGVVVAGLLAVFCFWFTFALPCGL
ncbi:MAG: MerR family transcriptional regulator [Lawsonibacter sp.]|jgi:DNA-binding transcriptional MerR regulator/uncharacterized RDD family membrane protein YckC|nr:MerR family transcriptional regulator [Lawsonibacter sp.]